MREPSVHGLAGLAPLDHELLGKGPGDGGAGVRAGNWGVRLVDGRGAASGAHAALRDARMVVPLSWNAEGVRECAFLTRYFPRGALLDQLQMHVVGDDGAYRIRTVCFRRSPLYFGSLSIVAKRNALSHASRYLPYPCRGQL